MRHLYSGRPLTALDRAPGAGRLLYSLWKAVHVAPELMWPPGSRSKARIRPLIRRVITRNLRSISAVLGKDCGQSAIRRTSHTTGSRSQSPSCNSGGMSKHIYDGLLHPVVVLSHTVSATSTTSPKCHGPAIRRLNYSSRFLRGRHFTSVDMRIRFPQEIGLNQEGSNAIRTCRDETGFVQPAFALFSRAESQDTAERA